MNIGMGFSMSAPGSTSVYFTLDLLQWLKNSCYLYCWFFYNYPFWGILQVRPDLGKWTFGVFCSIYFTDRYTCVVLL